MELLSPMRRVLLAFVISACSSEHSALSGKAASTPSTTAVVEPASSPVETTGSFLVDCAPAPGAQPTLGKPRNEEVAFGCAALTSDGKKALAARISSVKPRAGAKELPAPTLTPAPAASGWSVIFGIAAADAPDVDGFSVVVDGQPAREATVGACGEHAIRFPDGCEKALPLLGFKQTATEGYSYRIFALDFGTKTRTDWEAKGFTVEHDAVTYLLAPNGACEPRATAAEEDACLAADSPQDGTQNVYLLVNSGSLPYYFMLTNAAFKDGEGKGVITGLAASGWRLVGSIGRALAADAGTAPLCLFTYQITGTQPHTRFALAPADAPPEQGAACAMHLGWGL
jgi:hypothetical protein